MFETEMKNHLTGRLLPFWMGLRDKEYGGYYGYMDYDHKIDKIAVKGCILNSRILWTFSNAYLLFGEKAYLEAAEHAWEFMRNHCVDRDYGGVYWSVSFEGQPEDSTKHTYNQAFAVYALSSYYDASGDRDALGIAMELYRVIEGRCRDKKGYLEAFDREFGPAENDKLSENGVMAARTMNTLLHVFEAYTELYRITGSRDVAERLEEILELFETKIWNPDRGRQEVFFDDDWNSLIDLYSYGHDIESSWLIDRGMEILESRKERISGEGMTGVVKEGLPCGGQEGISGGVQEKLTGVVKEGLPCGAQEKLSGYARIRAITEELAKNIYERAYVNHSVANECERGVVDSMGVWWVLGEAVVVF